MAFCTSLPLTCTGTPSATCRRVTLFFNSAMPMKVGARSGRTTSQTGFEPIRFLPSFSQNKPASASQPFSRTRSSYFLACHCKTSFSYSYALIVMEGYYTSIKNLGKEILKLKKLASPIEVSRKIKSETHSVSDLRCRSYLLNLIGSSTMDWPSCRDL